MSTPDLRTISGPSAELGRLLVRFRGERGLAQKQVAQLASIDNSTLSRLESGDRGVSREVLDRICHVLELNRDDRLAVLVTAGFLSEDAAFVLADDDLSRLARLLNDSTISPTLAATLRQYLTLALAHASALGYDND